MYIHTYICHACFIEVSLSIIHHVGIGTLKQAWRRISIAYPIFSTIQIYLFSINEEIFMILVKTLWEYFTKQIKYFTLNKIRLKMNLYRLDWEL